MKKIGVTIKPRNIVAKELYSGKYRAKTEVAKKGKGSSYNRKTKHRQKFSYDGDRSRFFVE